MTEERLLDGVTGGPEAFGFPGEAVVPRGDGVRMNGVGLLLAPSIIEGRPWSSMPGLTCHWKAQACA